MKMEIIQTNLQQRIYDNSVVAIGMFDGVHLGHQALLAACCDNAVKSGAKSVALTYNPHPRCVLTPGINCPLLTTLDEKLALFDKFGIDTAVVVDFTPEFMMLSAEEYLNRIHKSLNPAVIIAGYRSTFGHNRTGNPQLLKDMAGRLGYTAEIISPIEVAGEAVSSSRIRELVLSGDVELAGKLLGYRYSFNGTVENGDARGRKIGFRTANIDAAPGKIIPGDAIYAGNITVKGQQHRAVMSFGSRPTFNRPPALEVHIIDYNEDIYGEKVNVEMLKKLRDIIKFDNAELLAQQIQRDLQQARVVD
jgi:riboflavin kinase/FMN adenylyltransferase